MKIESSSQALPRIVNLGIYRGACPCSCVHCPVGTIEPLNRTAVLGSGEVDVDLFGRFCADIRQHHTMVRLHGVGEPVLHSRFEDLLQIIRDRELQDRFWLFTCGFMREDLLRPLVESLGIIEVSINSCTEDDYRATKGLGDFTAVVRNICRLQDEVARNKVGTRILLSRVESGTPADEEFTSYWRERGFESFVRSYHSYSGILTARGSAPQETVKPKCLVPWRRFNLDGTLVPGQLTAVNCFNSLFRHPTTIDPAALLGSYPDQSLDELWNNAGFHRLRRQLMRGERTGTDCDGCTECLIDIGPRSEQIVSRESDLR